MLVVSQFTLYGNTAKGRRPSWIDAAPPEQAEPLVDAVVAGLRQRGLPVETGRFRTDMQVELVNDGPVTVLLERVDGDRVRRRRATVAEAVEAAAEPHRHEQHDDQRGDDRAVAEVGVPRESGAQFDVGVHDASAR